MIPIKTPIFKAGEPSTEVKYPFTKILVPKRVCVVASGSSNISLVTPKMEPVVILIRINANSAAKAPPAFSFAHEPPIAAAKRICKFVMTAHPKFSTTLPIVSTR